MKSKSVEKKNQVKQDPFKEYKELAKLSFMSGLSGAANGAVAGATTAAIELISSKERKSVKFGENVRESALIWGVSAFTATSTELAINKVTESSGDLNRYIASATSALCVSKLSKCNTKQTASIVAQNLAASFIFDSILIPDQNRVLNSRFSAKTNEQYQDVITTLKKPINISVDYVIKFISSK